MALLIFRFSILTIVCSCLREHSLIGRLPRKDSYISDFRSSVEGVIFSAVFSDNAVLQREPHRASLYGICDSVNASIILTMLNMDNLSDTHSFSTTSQPDKEWKIVLPKAFRNGGNYTLSVECPNCANNTNGDILYNVTFGDVFFCAGQSNMALGIKYTFSANYTYSNITNLGKYKNIRFFTKHPLATNDNSSFVIPLSPTHSEKYQWHKSNDLEHLSDFSAVCWYFAQSLSETMNDTNFGLIVSAIGGSMIESWIINETISNITNDTNCGALYNGMIAPFINMSIKAIIWYQGENNLFKVSDYSYLQKTLIKQWRAAWNWMNESLPFGIVQLVAGSDEGYPQNMALFRFEQQFYSNLLPHMTVPDTFIAMGYDVGDPWDYQCEAAKTCVGSDKPYNINDTKWFMSHLHARPKLIIGQRLALAAKRFVYRQMDEIWQGPVIKDCFLESSFVVCEFNQTLLFDEEIIVQPPTFWYEERHAELIEQLATHWTAFEVLIDGYYEDGWHFIEDNALSVDDVHPNRVKLDISNFKAKHDSVIGVRYAWSNRPCCGDLDQKLFPCPMNMCPLITNKSRLPAVPFSINITLSEATRTPSVDLILDDLDLGNDGKDNSIILNLEDTSTKILVGALFVWILCCPVGLVFIAFKCCNNRRAYRYAQVNNASASDSEHA